MKRIMILAVLMGLITMPAFAASANSALYNMSAAIQDEITIAVKWFRTNTDPLPANEIVGTTINWGNLVFDAPNNVYNGDMARLALITANNHSRTYTVTQTGTALTSGANTIPSARYLVSPTYVAGDNGGVTEGVVGTAGTAVATGKTLYTSGGVHGMRVIRAYYSLTNVPAAQAVGAYSGTVQFTITG